MSFLQENWGSLLVGGILLLIVGAIIRSIYIKKKSGQSACGCGCGGCSGGCSCSGGNSLTTEEMEKVQKALDEARTERARELERFGEDVPIEKE